MKKRINDSEIENARRTSRIMTIILIIIILLLVGCAIYIGILYKEGKIFQREDGELIIKDKTINTVIPSVKEQVLDINDSNLVKLLDIVKVTNLSCENENYPSSKKIEVESLSTKCKFEIAKNEYKNDIIFDSSSQTTYVKEKNVEEAFNMLFGTAKYERQETIPYVLMHDFMFDSRYNFYFITGNYEEPGSSFKNYEKLISARKQKDDLYIKTAVLYYEVVNSVICRDEKCESVVETISKSSEHEDDYFNLYLEHHKDKLYQYEYHFQLNSTGFYEYKGYERTNS